MKKLLYVPYPSVDILPQEFKHVYNFDLNFWTIPSHAFTYARYGNESIHLSISNNTSILPCPKLESIKETFSEVTDLRSIELLTFSRTHNKKVCVFWSGGIDSTVILASILKLWSKSDYQKVLVYMTDNSYFENPLFFEKYVEPNFEYKIINHSYWDELLDDFILVDGEPADKIWQPTISFLYGIENLNHQWKTHKHYVKNFISNKIGDKYASMMIDRIDTNINSLNLDLTSISDVFFWIGFNWHLSQRLYKQYKHIQNHNPETFFKFSKFYYPWYVGKFYQQWSISDNGKISRNIKNLVEFKMHAKQYIYELTKDQIQLYFQTSLKSRWIESPIFDQMIFDDGTSMIVNQDNYLSMFEKYVM